MKKTLLLLSVVFLAASCNPFSKPTQAGLLKTVNGGADWLPANVIKNNTATLANLSFTRIKLDPGNHEMVYAGSVSGGLFRSTDSAGTWQEILSKIFVYDIAVSPVNSKVLYAAGTFGDHGKVIKSLDGGATWQEVFNEESTGVTVRAIALNPGQPNRVVIGTSAGELIRSDDEGLSWRLVRKFNDRINQLDWQNDIVYVLGKTTGLFKSDAALTSFTQVATGLASADPFLSNGFAVTSFNQFYVDFLSSGLMYLATDKGLYKSVNGGTSWNLQQLPVKATDLGAYAIAVARTNSNLVYTSVGSTIYKSTDGGMNWQTQGIRSSNLVYSIVIDPQLPQIAYASFYTLGQ